MGLAAEIRKNLEREEEMELCSIASGSSGNCIYIGNGDTHLLVDVGISKKRIEAGLCGIEVDPNKLSGILITHEHSDHVSGLGVMSRKHRLPIYTTAETARRILSNTAAGGIDPDLFHPIVPGAAFFIGDIKVHSFSIPHDAANPVGYTFEADGKKVGVATDIGVVTDVIAEHLKGASALLLEANHDVHMLEAGTYPYQLKRRILGNRGHLSNENSGRLLAKIWSRELKHIFLGHLSEENNFPDLAYETVRVELLNAHQEFERYTSLSVASRSEACTPVIL